MCIIGSWVLSSNTYQKWHWWPPWRWSRGSVSRKGFSVNFIIMYVGCSHIPWRHQAIIWANVDQDACHHMVSLGHTELTARTVVLFASLMVLTTRDFVPPPVRQSSGPVTRKEFSVNSIIMYVRCSNIRRTNIYRLANMANAILKERQMTGMFQECTVSALPNNQVEHAIRR